MILKGTYTTGGVAVGVDVVNNLAYVADGSLGASIFDISDKSNPVLKGTYSYANAFDVGITTVGNLAYVTDLYQGLKIIDNTDRKSVV